MDLRKQNQDVSVTVNAIFSQAAESVYSPEELSDIRKKIDEQTTESIQLADVTLINNNKSMTVKALLDSGASCNCISKVVLQQLKNSGLVLNHQVQKQNMKIKTFGQEVVPTTDLLVLETIYGGVHTPLVFVVPDSSPADIIIGNGGMKRLHAVSLDPVPRSHPMALNCASVLSASFKVDDFPYVHSSPDDASLVPPWAPHIFPVLLDNGKVQLMACLNWLIHMVNDPICARPYPLSHTRMQVAAKRLAYMESVNQVERTTVEQISILEPPVLVDKLKQPDGKSPPVNLDDENFMKRWRITLACGNSNSLIPVIQNDGTIVALPKSQATNSLKTINTSQYQETAFQGLSSLPLKSMKFFATVDITDGYQCILIHPLMRRFFGCQVIDEFGQAKYYRWTTLPQGHRWSSILFKHAVTIILRRVQADPRIYQHIQNSDLGFANLQDDYLISASTLEICHTAMDVLLEHLEKFSLKVNKDKITLPTDSVNFCGWHLNANGVSPSPKRKEVTMNFAETAWERFEQIKSNPKMIAWLRAIAGSIQYHKGFITNDQVEELRVFYDLITALSKDPQLILTNEDKLNIKTCLYSLTDYISNGLPKMIIANIPSHDCICSVLIVDANVRSYCGILLKVVRTTKGPSSIATIANMPDMANLTMELRKLPDITIPEDFDYLPVYIDANMWTCPINIQRSSTLKERMAQFLCVDKMLPLIQGPFVVVCDNGNSRYPIDDPLSHFSGAAIPLWIKFNSEVDHHLWMPRDDVPKIADFVARIVESIDPTPVININSAQASSDQMETILRNNELIDAITVAYSTDEDTVFRLAPLHQIINQLTTPTDNVSNYVKAQIQNFRFIDGLLYYTAGQHPRLYIPQCSSNSILADSTETVPVRAALLHLSHTQYGAHLGTTRSSRRIKSDYWWPRLDEDIQLFSQSCFICGFNRAHINRETGTLSSTMLHCNVAYQQWMVDLAGPFRRTETTKTYVMLYFDLASRELRTDIVTDKTAETYTSSLLRTVIWPCGVPQVIHTDQGTNFTSQVTATLSTQLGINLKFGLSMHPRGQGPVERQIRDLKSALTTLLIDHHLRDNSINFADAVRIATAVHNSSPHRSTNISPNEFLTGLKPISPLSIPLISILNSSTATPDIITQHREFSRTVHTTLMNKYLVKEIDAYETRTPPARVEIGTLVYRTTLPGTVNQRITGPYKVINPVGSNSWEIQLLDDANAAPIKVPVKQLTHVAHARHLQLNIPAQQPISADSAQVAISQ